MSSIRHRQLHDSLLQAKRDCLVVRDFPHTLLAVPLAACLFDAALQIRLFEFDAQTNDGRFFRGGPAGLFDDQFDCGEAFALPLVITVADAEQLFAVAHMCSLAEVWACTARWTNSDNIF